MPTPTPPLALPALPELLHCPFCGCKAVWFKTGRDIGIECADGFDCPGRAQTNVYAPEHRQDVIAEWNRRVDINGNDIRDVAAILSDRAGRGDAAGWVSVEDARPQFVGEDDTPVWTWDGHQVREDEYGLEWDQPAGPVIGGWVVTGECFQGDTLGKVTHWMLRTPPAAPTGEAS